MPVCLHDPQALAALRRAARLDPTPLQRCLNRLLKQGRSEDEAFAALPAEAAARLREELRIHSLELVRRQDSADGAASKLQLETEDRLAVEAVLLRSRFGRASLCLSSQVGCGVGCGFCATGLLGARRNLDAAEILDQVVWARQLLAAEQRPLRNLVFMGMGEPLHNETEVYTALENLADPKRFDISLARCTLSTVGIAAAMRRCAARFPALRLALSLHSAIQERREALVPLARHESLDELREVCLELAPTRPPMLEYVMLAGRNDGAEDLEALLAWTADMACQINLIPLNPVPGLDHMQPSPGSVFRDFVRELRAAGREVRVRQSFGPDVEAACGQLVRAESRRAGDQAGSSGR